MDITEEQAAEGPARRRGPPDHRRQDAAEAAPAPDEPWWPSSGWSPSRPVGSAPGVRTSGLPDIDGAPGGTLEGFGILADPLNELKPLYGFAVDNPIREHCFVPAVSGVAVREPADHADLCTPIYGLPPTESPLDDFVLASQNEEHTLITEELSTWLLGRRP